jgi:hypothetical protein
MEELIFTPKKDVTVSSESKARYTEINRHITDMNVITLPNLKCKPFIVQFFNASSRNNFIRDPEVMRRSL